MHPLEDISKAYSKVPVPVAVATWVDGDTEGAITLGWFEMVSADPPYIAFSVSPKRSSFTAIPKVKQFAISYLCSTEAHKLIGKKCAAGSSYDRNKIEMASAAVKEAGLGDAVWTRTASGIPVVAECNLTLECEMVDAKELGDHSLFYGKVLSGRTAEVIRPALMAVGPRILSPGALPDEE